jgi:hypothetical protein
MSKGRLEALSDGVVLPGARIETIRAAGEEAR